jgi:segregation and condensation protein A
VAYHIQSESFSGPLDLLVSLAHRGQIDLSTLSLRSIAETYVERAQSAFDLEEATEVLVQLAVLTDLKVRTLVPHAPPPEELPEDGEEPSDFQERLNAQLAGYVQFREAAQALRALEDVQRNIFVRAPGSPDPTGDVLVEGVTLQDLFAAFARVLRRAREAPQEIAGEEFTIEQKVASLLDALAGRPDGVAFALLFRDGASRLEIIVTFLAMLELIKQRLIRVRQPQVFGDILLVRVDAP